MLSGQKRPVIIDDGIPYIPIETFTDYNLYKFRPPRLF